MDEKNAYTFIKKKITNAMPNQEQKCGINSFPKI